MFDKVMLNKKYYTIGEVTRMCRIHLHQLRYLETRFPELIVLKIKGRRYYTNENIEFIKLNIPFLTPVAPEQNLQNSEKMLQKIDDLIYKFCQTKLKLYLTN
jgi:hypothetical protein